MKKYLNKIILIMLLAFSYSLNVYAVRHHTDKLIFVMPTSLIYPVNVQSLEERLLKFSTFALCLDFFKVVFFKNALDALLNFLQDKDVETLRFGRWFNDYDAVKLADFLIKNESLEILHLDDNNIGMLGAEGLMALAKALQTNRTLTTFTFGVGEGGRKVALEMLAIISATNISLYNLEMNDLRGFGQCELNIIKGILKDYLARNGLIREHRDTLLPLFRDNFEMFYQRVMVILHGTEAQRNQAMQELTIDQQEVVARIINLNNRINNNLRLLGYVNRPIPGIPSDENIQPQPLREVFQMPQPGAGAFIDLVGGGKGL